MWSTPNKPHEVQLSECAFSIHSLKDSPADLLTYYGILRDYLQHEDGLINSRLTWSLTIHGFLFTTFGFLANKTMEILGGGATLKVADLAFPVLQMIVAGVGAAVAFYSHGAIVAAPVALQHLVTIAHSCGALRIQDASTISQTAAPPENQIIFLPRIRSGGAADEKTEGASRYYTSLPIIIMAVWILLWLFSACVAYFWAWATLSHLLLSVLGSG